LAEAKGTPQGGQEGAVVWAKPWGSGGKWMTGRVLLVLLLAMLGVTAAVGFLGVADVASAIAKTSFFVVPVVFMVSLIIGLGFRRRA